MKISGGFYCCPSNIDIKDCLYDHHIPWRKSYNDTGCSKTKKFIKHKEAKVQRALGLLN